MIIVIPPSDWDTGYVEMIAPDHDLEQRQARLEARAAEIKPPSDDDEAGEARRVSFRVGDPVLPGFQSPPLRPELPKRWGC